MFKKFLMVFCVIFLALVLMFSIGAVTPWASKELNIYQTKENLNIQQTILTKTQSTNDYIDGAIRDLITKVPVDGIHVSMMHLVPSDTPDMTPDAVKIDSTNALMKSGKMFPLENNLPVSEWRDYLGQMNKHRCAFVLTSNLTDPAAKLRVSTFAYATLACPIFGPDNTNLIGGLFLTWDSSHHVPACLKLSCTSANSMESIAKTAKIYATQIGQYVNRDLKN